MVTVETIGKIQRDHRVHGKSIKSIARTRDISRNTMRKFLRSEETEFHYSRRAALGDCFASLAMTSKNNGLCGGQGRNRTTDTRIFSAVVSSLWLHFSMSYRGARCVNCRTMQNIAGLIHAKFTHVIVPMQIGKSGTTDSNSPRRARFPGLHEAPALEQLKIVAFAPALFSRSERTRRRPLRAPARRSRNGSNEPGILRVQALARRPGYSSPLRDRGTKRNPRRPCWPCAREPRDPHRPPLAAVAVGCPPPPAPRSRRSLEKRQTERDVLQVGKQ